MPRYVVERSFPEGLGIPLTTEGAKECRGVVERNLDGAVTWLHSYVSVDDQTTVLRLRGAEPGSDQERRGPKQAPGRPDHRPGLSHGQAPDVSRGLTPVFRLRGTRARLRAYSA